MSIRIFLEIQPLCSKDAYSGNIAPHAVAAITCRLGLASSRSLQPIALYSCLCGPLSVPLPRPSSCRCTPMLGSGTVGQLSLYPAGIQAGTNVKFEAVIESGTSGFYEVQSRVLVLEYFSSFRARGPERSTLRYYYAFGARADWTMRSAEPTQTRKRACAVYFFSVNWLVRRFIHF
eukprot:SAG31_NODE_897_length_11148_cov_15.102815_13_plen_176_part_00